MSNVKQLADEEAERAEGEPDEPEPGDGETGEPDEQAAPDAPPVDAPPIIGPEQIAKAEKAIKDQRARLGKILGAESVAHDCFVCAGIGFMPELPPIGATFKVAQDGDDVLLVTESPDPETPLRQAPDKAACPECDGLGNVLSGSKNPNARVVACSKCMGNGWVMVARPEPNNATMTPVDLPLNVTAPNGEGFATVDAWGRPAGHQHWGVPPALIQA